MRIPIYESRAQLSTDTPGRSISARMSFRGADAIMRQGEATQAALKAVQDFADMRYEMILETRLNEKDVAMRDQLRDMARDLIRGKKLNALDEIDGQPSEFETRATAVRDKLKRELGTDRRALAKFEQSYQLASANTKWSLRDKFDDIIQARHQASIKSKADQVINAYSNPAASSEELGFDIADISAMLQRSADKQLINPELVAAIPDKIRGKVAENLVTAFVGPEPFRAIELQQLLAAYQNVQRNPDNAGVAENFANMLSDFDKEGGLYTSQVLLSIPPGEAQKIIGKSITLANRTQSLINAQDKARNDIFEKQNNRIESALSSNDLMFEEGKTISLQRLEILGVPLDNFMNDVAGGTIRERLTANQIITPQNPDPNFLIKDVRNVLISYLRTDPAFQADRAGVDRLEKIERENVNVVAFSQTDDVQLVFQIEDRIRFNDGLIDGSTVGLLRSKKSSLTRSTYERLWNAITQASGTFEGDLLQDMNRMLPQIDSALNFYTQERQSGALSPDSQAAQRAADDVREEFRRAVNTGQFDQFQGRERITEMQSFIDGLVATRQSQMITELRDDMVNELTTSIGALAQTSRFSVSSNDFNQFSTKAQTSDAIDKLNIMMPTTIDPSRANQLRMIVRRYMSRMP